MTSAAKIAANQRNALRSTGPRSRAGKRRVSQNALRHGLARLSPNDPARVAQTAALIAVVAPDISDSQVLAAAQLAVEAELEVRRVRDARDALLERHLTGVGTQLGAGPEDSVVDAVKWSRAIHETVHLCRYERRAAMRWRMAMRAFLSARIESESRTQKEGN